MLGLLAELILKQTAQAAIIQLFFIIFGVLACLKWLSHIYETKWQKDCCGKSPRECTCGQCPECKLWWGRHRIDCSQSPKD
jgi:hypothetical protein